MTTSSSRSRLEMGRVTLTVADLPTVRAFYEGVLGLGLLRGDGESAELGAGVDVLVELRQDNAARRRSAAEAGLFHTAFLLPTRPDLARWIRHVAALRTPIEGASDHLVSEAIYLSDPEGNGVEVYVDRPSSAWRWNAGQVVMATEALDIPGLMGLESGTGWAGAPDGTRIGHVHLQVGALGPAEAFYRDILGFDLTCRYPGGSFFSMDGYHHHLATNIWNSRGAGPRDFPSTGLAEFELRLDPQRQAAIRAKIGDAPLADPWGTSIRLTS